MNAYFTVCIIKFILLINLWSRQEIALRLFTFAFVIGVCIIQDSTNMSKSNEIKNLPNGGQTESNGSKSVDSFTLEGTMSRLNSRVDVDILIYTYFFDVIISTISYY